MSPCDGRVVEIVREREDHYLQREALRISTFLSVLNVHVQRAPLAGTVEVVEHQPGRFLQAFKAEASSVNEHIGTVMATESGTILVKQIAGILARRCVNYTEPGQTLLMGERLGLIRFGSRVDLFLPCDAEILVSLGDRIHGGITPVAQLGDARQMG